MRVNMDNVEKTTPTGWVVWAEGDPHVRENIIGIVVQGKSGYYHGFARFKGKDYKQSETLTLKGSVKKIMQAMSGL
jgi:hypothetical protein